MNAKKRVLIAHHSNQIGGAERSLVDFLKAVLHNNDCGYHFYVACPDTKGGFRDEIKNQSIEIIAVPFFRLKWDLNPFVFISSVLKIVKLTFCIYRIITVKRIDLNHWGHQKKKKIKNDECG